MTKKYLFLYRMPASAEQRAPSPAEIQAVLGEWQKWKATFPQVLDAGDGLLPTGRRVTTQSVTDGPSVESKELVSGYSIIAAATYEEAVKVAQACPFLRSPTSTVEVRELAGY
ncbi:MAG: YciI family protein [Sandaracinus sp.]